MPLTCKWNGWLRWVNFGRDLLDTPEELELSTSFREGLTRRPRSVMEGEVGPAVLWMVPSPSQSLCSVQASVQCSGFWNSWGVFEQLLRRGYWAGGCRVKVIRDLQLPENRLWCISKSLISRGPSRFSWISDPLVFREKIREARGLAQGHKASQWQKLRLESHFPLLSSP